MRKFFKRIWHDPVWSKAISTGILGFGTWVLYKLNWLPAWTARWIRATWDYLISPVLVSLPRWLLWVLVLALGFFVLRAVVSFISSLANFHVREPLQTDYNTDTIEGLAWHWSYAGGGWRIDLRSPL
jgi:hypothetical protein